MTRKEEIKEAARAYISGDILSSPSILIHFANGAGWADLHPNLESLWHDASEEPAGDNWEILCVDIHNGCWVDGRVNALLLHNRWDEYADIELVKMWAYISDLLPKGGKK